LVIKNLKLEVCAQIVALGRLELLSLVRPLVESEDLEIALAACEAAISLTEPGFRRRLLESRT